MSPTAVVKRVASVILQAGPAASTENIVPGTSSHFKRIAAPVIGLAPTSPVTADLYTSVTPVFKSIAKLPATPRFTASNVWLLVKSVVDWLDEDFKDVG